VTSSAVRVLALEWRPLMVPLSAFLPFPGLGLLGIGCTARLASEPSCVLLLTSVMHPLPCCGRTGVTPTVLSFTSHSGLHKSVSLQQCSPVLQKCFQDSVLYNLSSIRSAISNTS